MLHVPPVVEEIHVCLAGQASLHMAEAFAEWVAEADGAFSAEWVLFLVANSCLTIFRNTFYTL